VIKLTQKKSVWRIKLKAARNFFGKSRAAPSHNSRYEVAITVLTPAIAKRAHPALAWLLRIVANTREKRQSGWCKTLSGHFFS
jgi:hypothetical protein